MYGPVYRARNPYEFWSLWNLNHRKSALKAYRTFSVCRMVPHWVFSIACFLVHGVVDDCVWFVGQRLLNIALLPFGFFTLFLLFHGGIAVIWKSFPYKTGRLPFPLAQLATLLFMVTSSWFVGLFLLHFILGR